MSEQDEAKIQTLAAWVASGEQSAEAMIHVGYLLGFSAGLWAAAQKMRADAERSDALLAAKADLPPLAIQIAEIVLTVSAEQMERIARGNRQETFAGLAASAQPHGDMR